MVTSEHNWIRSLLRGLVSAFMLCEAIALYEIFVRFGLPELEFISDGRYAQINVVWMVFPILFAIVIELIAYFKVLKPISREALEKQFVTKNWVNLLFFLSFFFGGFITAGGIVAIALLAILTVALETKKE